MPEPYVVTDTATRFSLLRMVVNAGLFLVVLLGANWGVDKALPYRFPNQLQNKFDYFLAHSSNYNTIVIGSSLVWNQVFPGDMDPVLIDRGHESKTYNFGMHGVRFHEQELYTRKILEILPSNIDLILADVGIFETKYPANQWETDRFHWWHTPGNTLYALQRMFASSRSSEFKKDYLQAHLKSMGLTSFHVGEWKSLKKEYDHYYGGYKRPPKNYRYDGASVNKEMFPVPAVFERFIEDHRDGLSPLTEEDLNDADRVALKRYVQLFEDHGVTSVFVIPPSVLYNKAVLQADHEGIFPRLLAFNNPVEYPGLYVKEERSDEHHIGHEHTYRFGEALGRELADFLDETK
jgi:hypothetical protein